jgi:GNAT superfamily N-acetyltransferase
MGFILNGWPSLIRGEVSAADSQAWTIGSVPKHFNELPSDLAKSLPRRLLPVAILAWLGVAAARHGQGLGRSLLAQALCDCHEAGQTFAFIAVILDCVDEAAKSFYQRFDFAELPGHPYRLFVSTAQLKAMLAQ